MYAIVRMNTYDEQKLAAAAEQLQEFDRLHAAQPGFLGSVVVDVGEGRRFVVNLWDSQEASRSGQQVLVPEVQRLLAPLMAEPSRFLGAGPVVTWQMRDEGGR